MLNIPINSNSSAKRQHFVPRSYMKKWSSNGRSVNIYDKEKFCYECRKIENINYYNYFYDFRPGDFFIPDEALNNIFGFMQGCTVKYTDYQGENRLATTLREYNMACNHYDSWEVIDSEGNELTTNEKNRLITYLKQDRYSYSEEEWSKQYENQWGQFIDDIEEKLVNQKNNCGQTSLERCDLDLLFKYLIIYNWRTDVGNYSLNDTMNFVSELMDSYDMPIPPEDCIHSEDRSTYEEIRHGFMRVNVYKFLREESNSIQKQLFSYMVKYKLIFYLASQGQTFFTSDQPSMILENYNGELAHIMVATPTLLLMTALKDGDNEYDIYNANEENIKFFNKEIFSHAGRIVIIPAEYRCSEMENID